MIHRITPLLLAVFFASNLAAECTPGVPDWALPGSSTHHQVPPPAGFHRDTVTFDQPIGLFEGQSDIGGPFMSGNAWYNSDTGTYKIKAAGYNIWYFRDEFRFLWKKMSGDFHLAADITFEKPEGFDDRKVILVIRQDLDDNAKEAMAALHARGLIHLAVRPTKGADLKEAVHVDHQRNGHERLGLVKNGDTFTLLVSLDGEPLHAAGSATLHFDAPYYVGIGSTSHQPANPDVALVSHVELTDK